LSEHIHYDLLNVALTDLFLGNRDSSIINLDNAARLAEADKDSAILAVTFNVRAHYHLLMNDRNAWRENVLRSLAIGQALKHPTLLSGGYSQLIEYALAERNFEQALQLDAQARQILQKTNMPFFVVHLDSLMYEAHKGMGKKDVALDYFEKYYKGKYAILTREQAEKLDAIKASYDIKEKNMVIEKQRLELQYSERQTWFLLLLNLLFGILLAGGWFFRKMKKSYQGQLYKKEKWTEILLTQKEKASALKSPFDPQKTQVTIAGEGNMPIPSEDLEFISEDKKELYDNMIQAIENQKLYLNPNLDVNLIVTTLGTNKFYLYQAISKNASENFRNIINRYRVDEAKRLIEKMVNDKSLHNIEAIHTEAGFNSPSSFYRIFRNFTGLTPKEYANEYKADMKST
jgi:AraC-like DNA-binding protein